MFMPAIISTIPKIRLRVLPEISSDGHALLSMKTQKYDDVQAVYVVMSKMRRLESTVLQILLLASLVTLTFRVQPVISGLTGTYPILTIQNNTILLPTENPFFNTTIDGSFMIGQIDWRQGQPIWLWEETHEDIVVPPGGLIDTVPIILEHEIDENFNLTYSFTAVMRNETEIVGNCYGISEGEDPPEVEPLGSLIDTLPLADPRPTPMILWAYDSPPIEVGWGSVGLLFHNVAVEELSLAKTVVARGYSASVNVTVVNEGNFTETFNLTAYANTVAFASQDNVTLLNGTFMVFTLSLNTTGLALGNYTVSANITKVLDDLNPADNTFIADEEVLVAVPGDINGDTFVNAKDSVIIGVAFASHVGQTSYNSNADINDDGYCNAKDSIIIGVHFGGYRTRDELINDFIAFETTFPGLIFHESIGTTVLNQPIYLFKIGNTSGAKVWVDASIHGIEYGTSELLYWFADWLLSQTTEDATQLMAQNLFLLVPIINMDNYRISRYNAHNVDLNRNFETGWGTHNDPNRGPYALSEPETQAIHDALLFWQPVWYINLHSGDQRVSPPWGYTSTPTPNATYFQQVWNNYSALCGLWETTPWRWSLSSYYAGGLARDEGYALGSYSYVVEIAYSMPASVSQIRTAILTRFIPLMIVVGSESAVLQTLETPIPP